MARPDAAWLAEVIARLEARPELLPHLPVVVNNLGLVRGDRLVVPCQHRPSVAGQTRLAEVSVRHTRAVQAVLQAARSPIIIGELISKVAAEFPGRPLAKIEGMLTELVARHILITSLHPPMDVTDPLGHAIDQVTATQKDAGPLSMVQELRAISGQLSRHDQASSPGARRALRASMVRRMSGVCDRPEPSLAVDLRVGCSVVLPPAVAREAEAAVSALVRLAPHRFGNPAWQAWHARFRWPGSSARSPRRARPPVSRSPGEPPTVFRSCRASGIAAPCCGPPAGTCPGRVPAGGNGRRPGVGCGADIASRRQSLSVRTTFVFAST